MACGAWRLRARRRPTSARKSSRRGQCGGGERGSAAGPAACRKAPLSALPDAQRLTQQQEGEEEELATEEGIIGEHEEAMSPTKATKGNVALYTVSTVKGRQLLRRLVHR